MIYLFFAFRVNFDLLPVTELRRLKLTEVLLIYLYISPAFYLKTKLYTLVSDQFGD